MKGITKEEEPGYQLSVKSVSLKQWIRREKNH